MEQETIELSLAVVDEAMDKIRRWYPAGPSRRDMELRLERWLELLGSAPRRALGDFHPGEEPGSLVFSAEPHHPISGVAVYYPGQRLFRLVSIHIRKP